MLATPMLQYRLLLTPPISPRTDCTTPRIAGAACLPSALTATVRVRDLDICWNSNTNRTYQVEYRSDFTANMWLPLGLPVQGNGTTNCVIDSVPESSSKFYRVRVLP